MNSLLTAASSQGDSSVVEEDESQHESSTSTQQFQSFSKELFLEAVRHYKSLWDTNDASFKDRTFKSNAWKELCQYI